MSAGHGRSPASGAVYQSHNSGAGIGRMWRKAWNMARIVRNCTRPEASGRGPAQVLQGAIGNVTLQCGPASGQGCAEAGGAMLDGMMRGVIDAPLNQSGRWLAARGASADAVTLAGLALGLAGGGDAGVGQCGPSGGAAACWPAGWLTGWTGRWRGPGQDGFRRLSGYRLRLCLLRGNPAGLCSA